MKIGFLKNCLIGSIAFIGGLYILFLILPFIVSPIVNNYIPTIKDEIKKNTGLDSYIEGVKLVTTPKLTAGVKIDKFIIKTPEMRDVLNAENFQVKMSLLPFFVRKIRVDAVKLDKIDINLGLNKDGSFEIEKYLPAKTEPLKIDEPQNAVIELPFGLRLSNHLPDIKIGRYNLAFYDVTSSKSYIINGSKIEVTDFILNKNVKIFADGDFTLVGRKQFTYKIKLNNKIMPDWDLHELVFNPEYLKNNENNKTNNENIEFNILEIFKGIYNYNITADVNSDIMLGKESNKGFVSVDNMSVTPSGVVIPPSNARLDFSGNKININANLCTAKNENSTITGTVKTGKHTNIDLNIKSGADLANIVRIVNAFAETFNINDLRTLTANGKIDADFNIKSDLKTINSDGYLKIPSAKIQYGLYNITIDKINADILLANNNIDIKHLGFTIFEQPLKLYGLIKQDASADLHLTANDLSVKGLIIACGQASLLKENQINSGLVSLKADIVGKLDKIKPTAKVALSNLDIKNLPSNIVLKLPTTNVDIITDGQAFSGTASGSNIKVINPALTLMIPKLSANIKEDVIEVAETPVQVENINFKTYGKIKNYMTEKVTLDFVTSGDIKSKLNGDINLVKQILNLNYATSELSTIVIPMFDKSKMTFNSNLAITGSISNPQLSGTVNVPMLNIPEIPISMENINAKLQGDIINGSLTAGKFVNNGIEANNINSDFSMKSENLYLKNLSGNAFDGKFSGDIIYNISNTKTNVVFKGENMNAEKAIEGAAGIKGALTGTLNFDTKLNLFAYPDFNDLMRSISGNLSFKIGKGAFGKIGRLENFLQANNILANAVLKTTVASFSNIAAVKNSAQFDYINGEMTLSNGWANILNIKSAGKSIAYFVEGKYNLINGMADVTVLGRLDGAIVKLLGPVGELSAEKILSFIPKLGELTALYANSMTTDPDKERVKDIPALTTNTEIYKDFKVDFKGGIESIGSVKSFKWLSKVDTSAIEQMSIKDTVKSFKTNVNTDINSTVNTVKDTINTVKEQREQLKESVNELKNLFKLKPVPVTPSAEQVTTPVSETEPITQPVTSEEPVNTTTESAAE